MNTTILLDGDVTLHRACAAASTSVSWGDGSELLWTVNVKAAVGYVQRELSRLRKLLGAQAVIVALGDRNANFRKELCPTYKAHRTAYPKPPGFLEIEAEIVQHCRVAREARLEGDDMLGLLATKEPTEGKIIVTIDKDLLQIPGQHYNPDTNVMSTVEPWQGHERHLTQTLTGDRVDGYPGCPGIGPVRAAALLDQFETPEEVWPGTVDIFQKAGKDADFALLQARLAFVLRQGWYDRKTQEVKLWTPPIP